MDFSLDNKYFIHGGNTNTIIYDMAKDFEEI
jgi:hypothetical protein